MRAAALVAPSRTSPTYRVLDGSDRVVGPSEVHICSGACQGTGRCFAQPHRPVCRICRGSGRLLGAKPNQHAMVAGLMSHPRTSPAPLIAGLMLRAQGQIVLGSTISEASDRLMHAQAEEDRAQAREDICEREVSRLATKIATLLELGTEPRAQLMDELREAVDAHEEAVVAELSWSIEALILGRALVTMIDQRGSKTPAGRHPTGESPSRSSNGRSGKTSRTVAPRVRRGERVGR